MMMGGAAHPQPTFQRRRHRLTRQQQHYESLSSSSSSSSSPFPAAFLPSTIMFTMSPLRRPRTPCTSPTHTTTPPPPPPSSPSSTPSSSPLSDRPPHKPCSPSPSAPALTQTRRRTRTPFAFEPRAPCTRQRQTSMTMLSGDTTSDDADGNEGSEGTDDSSSSSKKKNNSKSEYQLTSDDRAESISETPLELTLAQELLMKQYEEQVGRMSMEECVKLALEIVRQMMVKDNILKGMIKDEKSIKFISSLQPPDPTDPEFSDDPTEGGPDKGKDVP